MKIIAYNANSDELPYFEQFANELGVEYKTVSEPLTESTVYLAEGYDAVTDFLPDHGYPEGVVRQLTDYGIHFISLRTAGFDGVDLELLKRYGMKMSNVPAYSPTAIAEFAVALTLVLLRNLQIVLPRVKTQDFIRTGMVGKELNKQTVGIIGTGRIGFEAAKIFKGFGSRVIGYDVYPNDATREFLEYKDSLDDIYHEADIISIHIPLFPENRHFINAESISKMKDGVYLINTARGGHVDYKDLLDAVLSQKVAGVAFDVYEFRDEDIFGKGEEGKIIGDPVFRELFSLPNVVITPHDAYNTEDAIRNLVKISTENIKEFIETGDSANNVVK